MTMDVLQALLGGGTAQTVYNYLTSSTSALSNSLLAGIYGIFQSIAFGLLLLWFVWDILDHAMQQRLTMDTFFQSLVRMLVSGLLIYNCMDLISAMVRLGDSLMGNFTKTYSESSYSSGMSAISAFVKADADNAKGAVGFLIRGLAPWIVIQAADTIIYLVCIVRGIDLIARITLAPLVVANGYTDSYQRRSTALRYMKKLLASVLTGIAILAVIWGSYYAMDTILMAPTESDYDSSQAIYITKDGNLAHKDISGESDSEILSDIAPITSGKLSTAVTMRLMRLDYSNTDDTENNVLLWWIDKASQAVDNQTGGFASLGSSGKATEMWQKIQKSAKNDPTEECGHVLYYNIYSLRTVLFLLACLSAAAVGTFKCRGLAEELVGV